MTTVYWDDANGYGTCVGLIGGGLNVLWPSSVVMAGARDVFGVEPSAVHTPISATAPTTPTSPPARRFRCPRTGRVKVASAPRAPSVSRCVRSLPDSIAPRDSSSYCMCRG